MGWTKALLGRLSTMWSYKKSRPDSESASSSYQPPVFADATATGVPELTLRELNKATRSFSAAMHIGRDAYRASLPIGNGRAAAVAKRLGCPPASRSHSSTWSASDDEFLRQQVLVLSRLRHDNVVRLLGYTVDTTAGVRVLLFEFADMGTLHDVLHGPTGELAAEPSSSRPALTLSWAQRASIALDVARGLEYLHDSAAVLHWGISSTNVLLFHGFKAKIADYDVFLQMPQDEDAVGNSLAPMPSSRFGYYPPEYMGTGRRSRCPNPKFDVYSYGIVLLELLTGRKRGKTSRDPLKLEWAAPLVRQGRVEGIMDPKLGTQYPPARALKIEFRPSMGNVAKMIRCYVVSPETTMAQVGS